MTRNVITQQTFRWDKQNILTACNIEIKRRWTFQMFHLDIPKCVILEDIYYNYLRNDISVCVNKMGSKNTKLSNVKLDHLSLMENKWVSRIHSTWNIFQEKHEIASVLLIEAQCPLIRRPKNTIPSLTLFFSYLIKNVQSSINFWIYRHWKLMFMMKVGARG